MSNAVASMTGFAGAEGEQDGLGWIWEVRSVNGRGLDLRLRLPDGWDALEPRRCAPPPAELLGRGTVTANVTLRRRRRGAAGAGQAALKQTLAPTRIRSARPRHPAPRAEALLGSPA